MTQSHWNSKVDPEFIADKGPPFRVRKAVSGRMVLLLACALLLDLAGCAAFMKPEFGQARARAEAPFPGPSDFAGSFVPQPSAVVDGLQSRYDGTISVGMLARATVEQVLPAGVALASQMGAATLHPVIYLVGTQNAPASVIGGQVVSICSSCSYQEIIVLIPFTVRGTDPHWHNYVVRMYLDDFVAVAGGDLLYGYSKKLSTIQTVPLAGDTTYRVFPLLFGSQLFGYATRPIGPWVDPMTGAVQPPRWPDLHTILRMPVLGQIPSDVTNPAGFVCSYWEWDLDGAGVAQATSQYQIFRALRAGMDNWVSPAPVDSAPDGAVSVRGVRWRLDAPTGCTAP